jgi:hypothetical protein
LFNTYRCGTSRFAAVVLHESQLIRFSLFPEARSLMEHAIF